MDIRKKIEDAFQSFVKWCKEIGGLIKEGKMTATAVFVFAILAIFAIVALVVAGETSASGEVSATTAEAESTTAAEEEALVVPDEPLEENAYPEINAVVTKYYQAMADGDIETLQSIMTGLDEKEQIKISKKSEYVESYPVVTCYTKKGPVEESYIVYAYYEAKLVDYESLLPGMNALYLCKNEEGAYYINGEEQDDKVIAYSEAISAQDDVVDLINTVQVKYNEVKAADAEVSAFLEELPAILEVAVGEELAKREEAEAPEEVVTEAATEEADSRETSDEEEGTKTVRTTDVVNVRSSDSIEADQIGKAQLGEEYTLLEEKGNGWSKILFEGEEAFIKTEYLEVVSEEPAEEDAEEEVDEESLAEAVENSPSSGTAVVKETVNIREDASTSADKVAVVYPGEELEVVTKRDDGWTEVKYKKKKGFVKSEFLE